MKKKNLEKAHWRAKFYRSENGINGYATHSLRFFFSSSERCPWREGRSRRKIMTSRCSDCVLTLVVTLHERGRRKYLYLRSPARQVSATRFAFFSLPWARKNTRIMQPVKRQNTLIDRLLITNVRRWERLRNILPYGSAKGKEEERNSMNRPWKHILDNP